MRLNDAKPWAAVLMAALVAGILAGAQAESPAQRSAEDLYQAALLKKEAEGDLAGAIRIFRDVVAKHRDRRDIAAKAQLQIGLCQQKLGNDEAEKAFRTVIDDYPEQGEAVREAREKLAVLLRARALAEESREFRIRQVWAGPEADNMGSISPDGRLLSFTDWTTGDLAVRDLAAGTNRRLTDKGSWQQSMEFAMFSRWAPDGRRLVYQWYGKDEIFELRVLDVKAPDSRSLYRVEAKGDCVQASDWSPDGKRIAALIFDGRGPYSGDQIRLALVSADSGAVEILKPRFETSAANPMPWGFVFSPDGKYIAYDASRPDDRSGKRDVFLLPVDGGAEIAVVEHPALDGVVDWTPGGEGLLFLSDRTGSQDIWFLRLAGGKPQGVPQRVKSGVGLIDAMGITSAGDLFYGLRGGATDVYRMDIDPEAGQALGPAEKVVLKNEGHNASPAYSPDGSLLAYISTPGMPVIQPRQTLGIIRPETGEMRELSPDLARFGSPRWAPDGRSLSVAGTDHDNRAGVFRVDAQTGAVSPIVRLDSGFEVHSQRWTPDGRRLLYTAGARPWKAAAVFVHDFETGRDEKLAGSPDDAFNIDISPDGRSLVLVNRMGRRSVRIMPSAGGEAREVFGYEPTGNFVISPAWSKDGRFVVFAVQREPFELMWDLYSLPVNGGEPRRIELGMGHPRHLSAHPDGRRLAFSSMGSNPAQNQVWVMENYLPPAEKR